MTQTIAARIATQRAEDLRILAGHAERAGVSILSTRDGASFAHDPNDAATLYRLSPESCDCKHFTCFGRCGHHALFLSELGQIPDDPDAALEALVDDRWSELVDAGEIDPGLARPTVVLIRAGALVGVD